MQSVQADCMEVSKARAFRISGKTELGRVFEYVVAGAKIPEATHRYWPSCRPRSFPA